MEASKEAIEKCKKACEAKIADIIIKRKLKIGNDPEINTAYRMVTLSIPLIPGKDPITRRHDNHRRRVLSIIEGLSVGAKEPVKTDEDEDDPSLRFKSMSHLVRVLNAGIEKEKDKIDLPESVQGQSR